LRFGFAISFGLALTRSTDRVADFRRITFLALAPTQYAAIREHERPQDFLVIVC
jgi:hypothetical protein